MENGMYCIAGKRIAVQFMYPSVHRYCADYRIADDGNAPDLSVQVTQADIDFERERSARENRVEGRAPIAFPDDYLEELAVYRQIAEQMPSFDTVLMHGSVIAADGEAFLFTAKSGTGKSTHTRLWREMLGERAVMVNDDKPLLHVGAEGVTAYGTPYNGKHRLGCNMSAPLKGICILTRAAENRIVRISAKEAYPMLLQQIYRPQNAAQMQKTLLLIDRLAAEVPFYRLGCNMDPEAAEVAYHGMKGD
ncbi:MAG: hypothetical protein IKI77_02070 [Oscillospiraceae bacterium]|nr:hypothetical protein [Oscillospiraceae bacterium]